MRTFRRILSVYFLGLALLCAAESVLEARTLLLERDAPALYLAVFACLMAAALLATAGWSVWREDASRKRWITAGSLLSLAVSLVPLALYLGLRAGGVPVQPGSFVRPLCLALVPMAFGFAGLFAFPREQPPAKRSR